MVADGLPRSLMERDWTDNNDNSDCSIFPALPFINLCHLGIKVTHLSVSVELRLPLQTINWDLCCTAEKLTFYIHPPSWLMASKTHLLFVPPLQLKVFMSKKNLWITCFSRALRTKVWWFHFILLATCSYRRANGGIPTHTFTGTTSSTRMAAAQLIHSGKNVHLTQSRRSHCQNLINILPCCTKLSAANFVWS